MSKKRDSEKLVQSFLKNGCAPALWSHHPAEVKAAIRAFGWRPQIKECFRNSQQFFLDCWRKKPQLYERLEYHEGYIQTLLPLEHAWLTLDGAVLELTLDPGVEREYLRSHKYSADEVLASVIRTGCWCPVDEVELAKLSPFYEMHMELLRRSKEEKDATEREDRRDSAHDRAE